MELIESQTAEGFEATYNASFDEDEEVAIDITKRTFVSVIASHKDKQVWFNVKTYNRITCSDQFFGVINAYLGTLSESAQENIIQTYNDIKQACTDYERRRGRFESVKDFSEWMKEAVPKLYQDIDYANFRRWMLINHLVFIPANTKDVYEDRHDTMHTRDKTYLRDEYIDLAAASYLLRLMVPIWGIFVSYTQSEYKLHKEFFAFRLLGRSSVIDYPAISKLSRYIPLFMTDQKQFSGAVFAGISKDDYPEHMLAYYVVRKLATSDPLRHDEELTLITGLHAHITKQFGLTNSNMAKSALNSKRLGTEDNSQSSNSSEEIQRSVMEQYQINENNSRGATQIGETVLFKIKDGIPRAIERMEPTMPLELATRFIEIASDTSNGLTAPRKKIQHIFLHGTMWVDTSVAMIEALDAIEINALFGLAAAINWFRGNYLVAAIMLAKVPPHDATETFDLTQTSRKGKFSREVREKFRRYYPYEQVVGNGKVRKNTGEESVELFIKYLSSNRWINTLPEDLTQEAVDKFQLILGRFDEIIIPENARDTIANYIFTVADSQAQKRDVVAFVKENRDLLISKL